MEEHEKYIQALIKIHTGLERQAQVIQTFQIILFH